MIRKTSATIIESKAEYGHYKTHFLGDSRRTIAGRNYAAPSVELLETILAWLGHQYGF